MEIEGFKSAWQKRSLEGRSFSPPARISPSIQFIRASAIRDLQRSDELSRFVFCLLFALVAIGVSLVVIPPGAARIAAWLFAATLFVDGAAGVILLVHRLRAPATAAMLDFIRREHRLAENKLRLECYSRRLMFVLATGALLLLIFSPWPTEVRENAFDALARMALITAFLAVAWRRAKSRSQETCRELERYLEAFEK